MAAATILKIAFLAITHRTIVWFQRNFARKSRTACRQRPRNKKLQIFKIQDGGRPPFWKLLNRYISVQNCHILMKFGNNSRYWTRYSHVNRNWNFLIYDGDGLHLENRFLGHNSLNGCHFSEISQQEAERQSDKGHVTKTANFQNSRWRTAAILKTVESPYISENIIRFWQHLVYYSRCWTWWDFEKHCRSILDVIR